MHEVKRLKLKLPYQVCRRVGHVAEAPAAVVAHRQRHRVVPARRDPGTKYERREEFAAVSAQRQTNREQPTARQERRNGRRAASICRFHYCVPAPPVHHGRGIAEALGAVLPAVKLVVHQHEHGGIPAAAGSRRDDKGGVQPLVRREVGGGLLPPGRPAVVEDHEIAVVPHAREVGTDRGPGAAGTGAAGVPRRHKGGVARHAIAGASGTSRRYGVGGTLWFLAEPSGEVVDMAVVESLGRAGGHHRCTTCDCPAAPGREPRAISAGSPVAAAAAAHVSAATTGRVLPHTMLHPM